MEKFVIKLLFFWSILFFSLISEIHSQQTTARLTINSGGAVDFYVNTFDKYQNGITYTNWTTVTVYFIDTITGGTPTLTNWKLDVKARDTDIRGTLDDLDLETIELAATHGGGPAAVCSPVFALSAIDRSLVTGGNQTNVNTPVLTTIYITYHCGRSNFTVPGNSLLGKLPDYYSVNIELTLIAE